MAGSTGGIRLVSGKDRVRFTDVIKSFKGWTTLLRVSFNGSKTDLLLPVMNFFLYEFLLKEILRGNYLYCI
jgi:hypothetical protein